MNKNNLKKQNSSFSLNFNVNENNLEDLKKSGEYNSNRSIHENQVSTESLLDLVKNYLNEHIFPASIKKIGKIDPM